MRQYVRKYPKFGDIFFIENGEMRFVQGADITTEEANSLQAVGVVYNVQGKLFDVVAGVNNTLLPWSVACDFEITAIPSDSQDCEVKLQNVVVGTFSYVKTEGTKAEFVEQLNTWLADNAPKWEAYMENETTAILQMSTYDSYESACTITGCTLVKRVGSELAAETISWCRNQVLQRTIYNGCCRVRLGEWAATQTSSNNNPTTRMNGTTQLFATFPCSEAYYNGDLGDGLRKNFATYEDYLDACMVRPVELREGIMRYKDGKPLADKLLNKKLLVRGVEKDAYPCAVWANNFDCGVEGYGAGTFHQAGMSELSRLMRFITLGTKQPLDAVNTSLSKRTGWSQISSASYRWAAGRYNTGYAWNYVSDGICSNGVFYGRLTVSAVARFRLREYGELGGHELISGGFSMRQYVRKYPKFGDIFFIENGEKRFVQGADITTEEADSLQAVGVVYNVQGKLFDVVAGVNNTSLPWSVACDFEITAIPSDSQDCEVKLQNKVVGTFSYVKTEGTKAEFVGQLNTWLADNAPKWEAYMENETTAILQMSTYDSYENACAITGCTLVKRVGSELAAETISWCRNQVLQRTTYNGCCRARLGEWAATQTSSNNNPTTRMNGTTQLFTTFPCSEAYYNGELGDGLRENFATYEDYLDACMVRPVEIREGIMRYKDVKPLADKLLNKKLLVRGVEKDAYPCAVWANNFDCGVEGYGAGTFHQAGMSELSRLMRFITLGTKQPLDAVNTSLSKRTGWSQISSTSSRWAAGRCYTNSAWHYNSIGICSNNYFYLRLSVSAVARFQL